MLLEIVMEMEILLFVEQSTSAIVMEQNDVLQFKVRMSEQLLHEHDQVQVLILMEIIISGEIIHHVQNPIGLLITHQVIMHGDEEKMMMS